MNGKEKSTSWLVPIINEKKEVQRDECGNIYIYNTANKTTGYMEDTEENRRLLNICIAENRCNPDSLDNPNIQEEDNNLGLKWSHQAILLLLSLYEENKNVFESRKKTNRSIWNVIASHMVQKGYIMTGDECDTKFRNLKKTYKRIKDNNRETGRGTITWPYFDRFDSIFAFSHAVQPLATASNTKGYMSCPSTSTDTDVSDDTIYSPVPAKKRHMARNNEVEPAWMKEFRKDQQERHNEKTSILKELIKVLKD